MTSDHLRPKRRFSFIQMLSTMYRINLCLLLIGWLFSSSVHAQEVSLSSELNIRNYYSYDLLGRVENRYMVLRDRGIVKEVDGFNAYLEHTNHAEILLEKKKSDIVHAIGLDSTFQLIYSYSEKDTLFLKMRRYNKAVVLQDSAIVTKLDRKKIKKKLTSLDNENKSKVLFYAIDIDDRFVFYIYDHKKKTLVSESFLELKGFEPLSQNFNVILTNKGQIFITLSKKYGVDKEESQFSVVHYNPFTLEVKTSDINMDKYRRELFIDYDNLNDKILICGTYTEKKGKDPKGYYILNESFISLSSESEIKIVPFPEQLNEEVGRSKRKKSKIFEHFTVKNIVKRNDGGFIIMMELSKEFSRRNSYSAGFNRGNQVNTARGWVDYYNEDIVVSSLDPDLNFNWSKILYKKQFSQDDNAVFSSFFVMRTPSRLRLLYNDEVKKNNTVSEYILDPTGKLARNSLLSTQNQDMKLRFRDALQLSNNEILVPSENNYELNLVKITY